MRGKSNEKIEIALLGIKAVARRRAKHFQPLDVKAPADFINRVALSGGERDHHLHQIQLLVERLQRANSAGRKMP